MSSTNDITGDYLVNKATTDAYRDGYDRIFGKKKSWMPPEQPNPIEQKILDAVPLDDRFKKEDK